LIDIRELREFETCRLDNSELLPMDQPASLKLFHESPEYVIICHHGINNTVNLDGGVDA
jgi:rhodanese-related sulfurtransferase